MMELIGTFLSYSNYIVLTILFVTAVAVLQCNSYMAAVITLNVFSLLSALEYVLLGAPDVSVTEASINACFSCVLLLCAGYLIKFDFAKSRRFSWPGVVCIISSFISICVVASGFPGFGLYSNPVVVNGSIYHTMTAKLMQFPNVVTAILAGFRGYDTLWETVVIFAAAVSVFAILRTKNEC